MDHVGVVDLYHSLWAEIAAHCSQKQLAPLNSTLLVKLTLRSADARLVCGWEPRLWLPLLKGPPRPLASRSRDMLYLSSGTSGSATESCTSSSSHNYISKTGGDETQHNKCIANL